MDLLSPGQIFAQRYRVERYLARGGMGAVFVGMHLATEQRVAIKVLWPNVLAKPDALAKFAQEAKIAGRVPSDHIVRVIDAGVDYETRMPFLVMELLTGQTLAELVALEGPLDPDRVVRFVSQIASGLDRAHAHVDKDGRSAPVIHRDLKPDNLFLTHRDTGEELIKILDFGIAKIVEQGGGASREVKGTPLYMSIEQAAGERITPRTDVWALGLVTFFLLTGKSYWLAGSSAGSGMTELLGEVIALPIIPPTQRARDLGGGAAGWGSSFDAWFLRCVNRDPAARFGSAGEAAQALGIALGRSSARIPAPPAPVGSGRVPLVDTGTTTDPGETRVRSRRAADDSFGPTALAWAGAGAAVVIVAGGVAFAVARLAAPVPPAPATQVAQVPAVASASPVAPARVEAPAATSAATPASASVTDASSARPIDPLRVPRFGAPAKPKPTVEPTPAATPTAPPPAPAPAPYDER